jgi:rhamnogalacturonyl hydrolase YesR
MFWRGVTTTFLLCTAAAFTLSACSTASPENNRELEPFDSSSQPQTSEIFSSDSIIETSNAVADWQIEHMTGFEPFVPSFQERSLEKRGWIQGAFLKGLADWAVQTDNEVYLEFLKNYGAAQNYQLGDRDYHADDHVVGQYYLRLYDYYDNPEMYKPTQDVLDRIIANPSTVSLEFEPDGTEEGYYKECLKRWCWADALFMSPPVFTKLSKVTGDPKYLEFSDKEFWATTDYLFDEEANLFLRDSRFFERREEMGEKIFWSRGNGWVFAGLTDILDDLPADHPSRSRYLDLYKDMAEKLITVQAENGFWPVSLDAGSSYPVPESSGTAFFVAGLAWGVANGVLEDEIYLPSIRKGWMALEGAVTEDGMIGWVQQVGYAPDKVSADETQFYGAGAMLLAGEGMLTLSEMSLLP